MSEKEFWLALDNSSNDKFSYIGLDEMLVTL